ncbi:hypothetical protein EZJ49_11000 [Bdellovibrio bacteriovorus]|uniref:hypothetical protein n=1 Tax=Bdellovibrio bacteriovorus TaxID=959 RepID=UPI0021D04CA6|nr:hypothetical protein [Bdellovibrio bacteriovorus]UXR63603.1 hypothetical protein EZJ49_11000 [Bdellovibrio bacteriovorus]
MIRLIALTVLVFLSFSVAQAQSKKLMYSCQLQDKWLQGQKLSAGIDIQDLDRASLTIQSPTETVTCPLAVESVQDASRGRIAKVIFLMTPEACSPAEKSFNRNLRRRIELHIDAQPGSKGDAQLSWRHRGNRSQCKEVVNNLKSHGIGNKFHPAPANSKSSTGTR